MVDITMCHGEICPLKEKCFRHKAIPGYMQSYFLKIPYNGNECEYYTSDDYKKEK